MNDKDRAVDHSPTLRAPGRHQVVLGSSAFIKGWFTSVVLWVVPLCLILVVQEVIAAPQSESGWTYAPGIAVTVLWYGFGIALLFAAPLAGILGYLLRPVLHQWIHVAVFFVVPTLVFWVIGGLLGFGWTVETLGFWTTVGTAAAIGRLAVRKNADLVQVQFRD